MSDLLGRAKNLISRFGYTSADDTNVYAMAVKWLKDYENTRQESQTNEIALFAENLVGTWDNYTDHKKLEYVQQIVKRLRDVKGEG